MIFSSNRLERIIELVRNEEKLKESETQLAKELMQIRPDIPIIRCTGFSERITLEKARNMGIRELLMKPVAIRKLAKTVRRVLDRKVEGKHEGKNSEFAN